MGLKAHAPSASRIRLLITSNIRLLRQNPRLSDRVHEARVIWPLVASQAEEAWWPAGQGRALAVRRP
jgi:hypothetical protein